MGRTHARGPSQCARRNAHGAMAPYDARRFFLYTTKPKKIHHFSSPPLGVQEKTQSVNRGCCQLATPPTARDLGYFSVDTGTSQQRMARHDQSRVACVGWRSSDLPTAIAPRLAIPSVSRAWVVGIKLAPNPARAYRRSQGVEHVYDLGGLGEPWLHRSADPTTCLDRGRAI